MWQPELNLRKSENRRVTLRGPYRLYRTRLTAQDDRYRADAVLSRDACPDQDQKRTSRRRRPGQRRGGLTAPPSAHAQPPRFVPRAAGPRTCGRTFAAACAATHASISCLTNPHTLPALKAGVAPRAARPLQAFTRTCRNSAASAAVSIRRSFGAPSSVRTAPECCPRRAVEPASEASMSREKSPRLRVAASDPGLRTPCRRQAPAGRPASARASRAADRG